MGVDDEVQFASTAEGVTTTTSALTVTDQLTIDGTSAPNYDGTEPLIELAARRLSGTEGITLNAAGSSIKGLALYRYPSAQVHMLDGSSSLENSWIGWIPVEVARSRLRSHRSGVLVEGDSNTVGSYHGAPNVISGTDLGMEINDPGVGTPEFVSIIGNRIGTAPSGFPAAANSGDGVSITEGDDNVIGGSTTAERNVISGNGQHGVDMRPASPATRSRATTSASIPPARLQWGIRARNRDGGPEHAGRRGDGRAQRHLGEFAGILFDSSGGFAHDGSTVYGNFIGTNAAGTGAVANGRGAAVTQVEARSGRGRASATPVSGQTNVIGHTVMDRVPGERSAARVRRGFQQPHRAAGERHVPLPNGDDGIDADDSDDLEIAFNTIAANGGTGVRLRGSSLSRTCRATASAWTSSGARTPMAVTGW